MRQSRAPSWAACLCLSLMACQQNPEGVVPVAGTVTFENQPVPGVSIYFQPEDGRSSVGRTDDQGRFQMTYTRQQHGVQLGKHQVKIAWEPAIDETTIVPPEPSAAAKGLLEYFKNREPHELEITKSQPNLELSFP